VGRFVPVGMVVERGDATGAWYWKDLPATTLAFERRKCVPGHKLSKERLTVMCFGNKCGNNKVKLKVIEKSKKNHDRSRVVKKTSFLSIITARKHGWIGKFF
jgi:hypothetical protein